MLCLDEATGKELWKHEYPVKYTISYPAGPRCTPTVADGKVYTLGAEGNLFCFDADTGDVLWSNDFNKDYGTKTALWGYAGHPLVDGNKLICIVGGEGSYVVAFDKDTGKELWKNLTSPEQGYSPPAILEIAGQRQLVLLRPDAVTALDPETGNEIWSVPYESTNGLVVMTPVLWNDYLFVGGYANKNMLIKLAADGRSAEVVWKDNPQHAFSPVNVQPTLDGDMLYGFDQNGRLYGVKLPDGERLWDTTEPLGERPAEQRHGVHRPPGRSLLAVHRERRSDRRQALARAATKSSAGPTFSSRRTTPSAGRSCGAAPAFANRRMYVRNDKECVAIELSR